MEKLKQSKVKVSIVGLYIVLFNRLNYLRELVKWMKERFLKNLRSSFKNRPVNVGFFALNIVHNITKYNITLKSFRLISYRTYQGKVMTITKTKHTLFGFLKKSKVWSFWWLVGHKKILIKRNCVISKEIICFWRFRKLYL